MREGFDQCGNDGDDPSVRHARTEMQRRARANGRLFDQCGKGLTSAQTQRQMAASGALLGQGPGWRARASARAGCAAWRAHGTRWGVRAAGGDTRVKAGAGRRAGRSYTGQTLARRWPNTGQTLDERGPDEAPVRRCLTSVWPAWFDQCIRPVCDPHASWPVFGQCLTSV